MGVSHPLCAVSADEADSRAAFVPFRSEDQDSADLARVPRMRPAARLGVEALDLHQTDRIDGAFGGNDACAPGFGEGEDPDIHGQGPPDDRVGSFLARYRSRGIERTIEVDGGFLAPEMEAHRARTEQIEEGAGEDVLAVVLLAVVGAARSVHMALDSFDGVEQRGSENVENGASGIDDSADRDAVDQPSVRRLTAGLGVERRLVEHDCRMAVMVPNLDDRSVELEKVGIEVEESLRQHPWTCFGKLTPRYQRGARVSAYLLPAPGLMMTTMSSGVI